MIVNLVTLGQLSPLCIVKYHLFPQNEMSLHNFHLVFPNLEVIFLKLRNIPTQGKSIYIKNSITSCFLKTTNF